MSVAPEDKPAALANLLAQPGGASGDGAGMGAAGAGGLSIVFVNSMETAQQVSAICSRQRGRYRQGRRSGAVQG